MTAPPIPYYGGKQRIAQQIVSHFPDHLHYVEPYCGGLSVLLAKPPSQVETVNDLDHDLVTFWRVLRDRPDDLARVCSLTPHARAELDACREPMTGLDDLEVARRVWSQLAQGRAGRRTRTGWRFYVDASTTSSGMSTYLRGYIDRMPPAAARLASVQIECMPAIHMIGLYGRSETSLLYVDPPYLGSTRRSKQYLHELDSERDHLELADALLDAKSAVVLSGYDSPLYRRVYADWHRVDISTSTQQGGARSPRTEVLWMNREPAVTLQGLTFADDSGGGDR